jgi:hypothetical protein
MHSRPANSYLAPTAAWYETVLVVGISKLVSMFVPLLWNVAKQKEQGPWSYLVVVDTYASLNSRRLELSSFIRPYNRSRSNDPLAHHQQHRPLTVWGGELHCALKCRPVILRYTKLTICHPPNLSYRLKNWHNWGIIITKNMKFHKVHWSVIQPHILHHFKSRPPI